MQLGKFIDSEKLIANSKAIEEEIQNIKTFKCVKVNHKSNMWENQKLKSKMLCEAYLKTGNKKLLKDIDENLLTFEELTQFDIRTGAQGLWSPASIIERYNILELLQKEINDTGSKKEGEATFSIRKMLNDAIPSSVDTESMEDIEELLESDSDTAKAIVSKMSLENLILIAELVDPDLKYKLPRAILEYMENLTSKAPEELINILQSSNPNSKFKTKYEVM